MNSTELATKELNQKHSKWKLNMLGFLQWFIMHFFPNVPNVIWLGVNVSLLSSARIYTWTISSVLMDIYGILTNNGFTEKVIGCMGSFAPSTFQY